MAARVVLKPHREVSVLNGHPWVFSGAVKSVEGEPADGDVVDLFASGGSHLGRAHYSPSGIVAKLLTRTKEEIDERFFRLRFLEARARRTLLGLPSVFTNAYRLVNAEGDGLPGLIIDIYGDAAVVQAQTKGMAASRADVGKALGAAFGDSLRTIYHLTHGREGTGEYLLGSESETEVLEHGKRFLVNWESGQKTGFFLDQRENRRLLGELSRGKRVLNTFCFTGGFSAYAGAGGADEVVSVDSSKPALELLERNMSLNGVASHTAVAADCFDYLAEGADLFDVVIVDPPAFAKHLKAVQGALRGYERLNTLALKRLRRGGLLFTFSCSGVITRDALRGALVKAAAAAKREARIVHQLAAAPCHPVSLAHAEGEYLKGFVLEVS